jgi:hypothetical protein
MAARMIRRFTIASIDAGSVMATVRRGRFSGVSTAFHEPITRRLGDRGLDGVELPTGSREGLCQGVEKGR